MRKRMSIMIIILVIVFGGIFAWNAVRNYFIKQYFANYQPPLVTISATKAKAETWQPSLLAVGTLKAVEGVNLSTEQSGIIDNIDFTSGKMVKKGDLLIELNDAVEQAGLKNNQADYKLKQISFNRTKKLYEKKTVSQSTYDIAEAKLAEAEAQVDKIKATIAQKNIRAPFSGKIGIRLVNIGQYVSAGASLVSLQSLDPLHADFSLPEQNLNLLTTGQPVQLTVATYPKKIFKGTIGAIDATSDPKTHNILIRAEIPNPNLQLYPGLFANISVILPEQKAVVTVPETAVAYSLFGNSIFVIKQVGKDKKGKPILKVSQHYIKTGEHRNGKVAILEGIKTGDQIVTSGQLKLKDGTRVLINNKVQL